MPKDKIFLIDKGAAKNYARHNFWFIASFTSHDYICEMFNK